MLQILCPDKPFHWARHISIAFVLIFIVNLLVIFVPSIRDIFGLIGMFSLHSRKWLHRFCIASYNYWNLHLHLQEPHPPPASSSSYLGSSTSGSSLKTRSLWCPGPRFRYESVPSAAFQGISEHVVVDTVTVYSCRPRALLRWASSSWSWVCHLSWSTGRPESPGAVVGTSCRDWTQITPRKRKAKAMLPVKKSNPQICRALNQSK